MYLNLNNLGYIGRKHLKSIPNLLKVIKVLGPFGSWFILIFMISKKNASRTIRMYLVYLLFKSILKNNNP